MKRKKKKLALHRETVRVLSKEHLTQVDGGGHTHEIFTGCACTDCCNGTNGCGTNGCGSNGCTNDTCTCIFPLSNCVCP